MAPIAYTTLQVIPTLKGLEGHLKGSLITPLATAGKKAGQDAGDAYAAGLASAKGKVEKAAQTLSKARDKEADAAGKVRVAEKQLEDVRTNARAKAGQVAAAEERLEAARRKSAAATKDAADANKKLSDSSKSFGDMQSKGRDAGDVMGGGFMAGFGGKIGAIGSKAGPIALAVASVGAIGLAAGGVLAKAINDGMQREVKQDMIQAQLGVDEATAARIGKAAGGAYTQNFGSSVAENMDAATAAIQAGLLTGTEDQAATEGMIARLSTVAGLMGEDVPRVAKAAGQAIRTGMAKDGAGALDLLTASTQKGLNSSEDLLDTLNEYGTQFRKLGLSGEDAMGLVSQAVKAGARDTDVAADAIKEFSIRAVNGSESTSEGFANLGLDAQDMASKFAQGGTTARDAFGQVLDKVRGIEDPVKRGEVAVQLFGTQAEDLGGALGAMDLSNARNQLGQVAGAADQAAQTIGNNSASKIESAKRSIEESANGIKIALADAFGPSIGKMADWVSQHQPEIIGFFTSITTAALDFGKWMAQVAAGALDAWALFATGIAASIGQMGTAVGLGGKLLGEFISVIPGTGDAGDKIKDAAEAAAGLQGKLESSAASAHGMADAMRNELIPGMDAARASVGAAGAEAQMSADLMRGLGTAVFQIPDSHTVTIQDNSPATVARLDALGFRIEAIPGTKDFKVLANTPEAQEKINAFIKANATLPAANMPINPDVIGAQMKLDNFMKSNQGKTIGLAIGLQPPSQRSTGSIPGLTGIPKASGGIISGAGTGTSDSIPAWLSNGEFVTNAKATARNRPLLEAINRGAPGFASGGIVQTGDPLTPTQQAMWDIIRSQFPDAVLSSATRTQESGAGYDFHMQGNAIDISGPSMGAINSWIAEKYPDSKELFYDPGANIDEGQSTGAISGHSDHVHWAMGSAPMPPDAQMQGGPPPALTEEDRVADAIIAEGRRRGISDKGIKIALATGLAESGLRNLNYGDRDSVGVFQQRNNGAWGTHEDRMDPARSAGMFYDELAKTDYENMDPALAAQGVQRSAFSDGSNYQAQMGRADEIFSARGAQVTVTDNTATASSGEQQVFVTNWPSGLTVGGDGASTSLAPDAGAPPAPLAPEATNEPFVPGGAAKEQFKPEPVDVEGRARKAGEDFFMANAQQLGSDLGYTGDGVITKAATEIPKYLQEASKYNITFNVPNVQEAIRLWTLEQRRKAKSYT